MAKKQKQTKIELIQKNTNKPVMSVGPDWFRNPTADSYIWFTKDANGKERRITLPELNEYYEGQKWKLYQDTDGNYYTDLEQNVPKDPDKGKYMRRINGPLAAKLVPDKNGPYFDGSLEKYYSAENNLSKYLDADNEDYVYHDDVPYLISTPEYELSEITVYPSKKEKGGNLKNKLIPKNKNKYTNKFQKSGKFQETNDFRNSIRKRMNQDTTPSKKSLHVENGDSSYTDTYKKHNIYYDSKTGLYDYSSPEGSGKGVNRNQIPANILQGLDQLNNITNNRFNNMFDSEKFNRLDERLKKLNKK